jgi:hypothetical protein
MAMICIMPGKIPTADKSRAMQFGCSRFNDTVGISRKLALHDGDSGLQNAGLLPGNL